MITKIVTLRASAEIATATTENGAAIKLQRHYTEMVVTLDVTAAATAAGDILDVYVDTSFDGGTTWVNLGRFTRVLGNGGAKKFIMSFAAVPLTSSNSVAFGADQSESAALQIGFGDNIRYRGITTQSDTVAFTYLVTAFLK